MILLFYLNSFYERTLYIVMGFYLFFFKSVSFRISTSACWTWAPQTSTAPTTLSRFIISCPRCLYYSPIYHISIKRSRIVCFWSFPTVHHALTTEDAALTQTACQQPQGWRFHRQGRFLSCYNVSNVWSAGIEKQNFKTHQLAPFCAG